MIGHIAFAGKVWATGSLVQAPPTIEELVERFDGAAHHHAVACAGTRGMVGTRHGEPDRWDWGVTIGSLLDAWHRHERMQALADSLTPAQRAALWQDTSQQAAKLRRFCR